jgi:hypothetical protein
MARGGHRLAKVSSGLTKPYPPTPSERATPEMDLRPFQEWPVCRAGSLLTSSTLLNPSRRTLMTAPQSSLLRQGEIHYEVIAKNKHSTESFKPKQIVTKDLSDVFVSVSGFTDVGFTQRGERF